MENIESIGIHCFGCRACEQSCPKKCITMKENDEGFIYPEVDNSICVNCHRCLNVCPANHDNDADLPIKVFAMKNKDRKRLYNSASGGASDALANYVIDKGGVVFGVAYTETMKPAHIKCTTKEDLNKIQSSKYVASDTNNTFSLVKEELNKGKLVLYTGTSCQIKGLELYLGKDYSNLITVSIVCHGTPSFKAFRTYLDSLEKKYKSKVVDYNFRSKRYGWGLYIIIIIMEDGRIKKLYRRHTEDLYLYEFLDGGKNYRESCYECKFATKNGVGDLCIGDYWGIEDAYPKFYDKLGVSLITANTDKGLKILEEIPNIELLDSTLENAIKNQGNMKHPTTRKQERDTFYKNLSVDRYFNYKEPFKYKAKWVIRRCTPDFVIRFVKKVRRKNK